jgi:hypothetical protein
MQPGRPKHLTADFGGNVSIPAREFAHRYPDNGSVESICLRCLLIVCSCRGVEQMMQEEAKHVCQPDAASTCSSSSEIMRARLMLRMRHPRGRRSS